LSESGNIRVRSCNATFQWCWGRQAANETYSYDVLNRLSGLTRGSDTFGYEYDNVGNVTKRTYPDGTVLDYSYDDDGRMAPVKVGGSTVAAYGYNADGLPTSAALPAANGYVETRSYDRAGRLSALTNTKSGTDLSRFTYTRDPVGNSTRIDKVAGGAETYGYDELDRLTEVCYQAAACSGGSDPFIRWTYDEVGNRLTEDQRKGA
jgi:YD repeat-containing protein